MLHLQEPTTLGWYWLYLPEDYRAPKGARLTGRRWPLVVTFHGMKPFDTAHSQIREWQQEADRYGFVVIAPQCRSPDLLKEFPLRTVHPGVLYDEQLTTAVLDDVARRVDVDPAYALSTSWSSGGYLAHYMANRHPERFSCIAPRQSNFSADVLDPRLVARYRDRKVGIFYTENDFAICRRESQEAARWYSQHGFDVTLAVFKDLGHERRPSVAAAFYATTCGATAKTPPTELAGMQVKRVPLPQLAAAGRGTMRPAETRAGQSVAATGSSSSERLAGRTDSPRQGDALPPTGATPATPDRSPTVPTPLAGDGSSADGNGSLRVRVSSTAGIAPFLVSFSALTSAQLRRGAYFLWTDNGEPVSNGINGQKYLTTPGEHILEVFMTTSDGKQLRASKAVHVLERVPDGHPSHSE